MLVYIDLELETHRRASAGVERVLAQRLRAKYRFEDLTNLPCLIVRYYQATPERLHALGARAVLVSGCSTQIEFSDYAEADLAGLRAIYLAAAWPLLGFCGGHQLLAEAYGSAIGPLAAANGSESEHGFLPVAVRRPHPLFAGLGPAPVMFQMHRWEVKAPPPGFDAPAASPLCPVQALADDERRLYGTQFHPEEYDDAHPAGRQLLENFFRLAGVLST